MTVRTISILITLVASVALFFGLVVVAGATKARAPEDPWRHVPVHTAHVDHAAFFAGPFADGPAVTRACLGCHADAAAQVMRTSHWSWAGEDAVDPRTGEPIRIGKRNLQNNFCISIAGNWPRCTSCHVGYGWRDDTFFETATEEHVDCLVCHDRSGQYQKAPTAAGHVGPGVDLLAAARSVGRTTRASCGTCHFKGGGGDGVKHGDLDETMYFPPERVDVHMGKHGLVCADCHKADDHRILGRLLPPERAEETRVNCTDCHDEAPHAQDRLNSHVKTLACQTCHIPTFAVETGTKMWWDWSLAGLEGDAHEIAERLTHEIQNDEAARAGIGEVVLRMFDRVGTDADLWTHYDRKKGLFLIARAQVPEYHWYDRTTQRYLPGESVADGETAVINRPHGTARDPQARIWPFKIHRGRQPRDLVEHHLLTPHVFGEGGYWKEYDWESALRAGAAGRGSCPSAANSAGRRARCTGRRTTRSRTSSARWAARTATDRQGRMDWEALGYAGDPAFHGDRRQMDLVRDAEGDR